MTRLTLALVVAAALAVGCGGGERSATTERKAPVYPPSDYAAKARIAKKQNRLLNEDLDFIAAAYFVREERGSFSCPDALRLMNTIGLLRSKARDFEALEPAVTRLGYGETLRQVRKFAKADRFIHEQVEGDCGPQPG